MLEHRTQVLTYGTFDLFHVGHLRILERARNLGDDLNVGVSTDCFNAAKGKSSAISFEQRLEIVSALRCVSHAFPEYSWEQKIEDVKRLQIDRFVIGDDWEGHFDFLKAYCEVIYLPRTPEISSSAIKRSLTESNGKGE